jgi:hypothetical protein
MGVKKGTENILSSKPSVHLVAHSMTMLGVGEVSVGFRCPFVLNHYACQSINLVKWILTQKVSVGRFSYAFFLWLGRYLANKRF